jgi:hypothetical protein
MVEREGSEVDVFKGAAAKFLIPVAVEVATCSSRLGDTGFSGRDDDRGRKDLRAVTSYAHGALATVVVFVGGRGEALLFPNFRAEAVRSDKSFFCVALS